MIKFSWQDQVSSFFFKLFHDFIKKKALNGQSIKPCVINFCHNFPDPDWLLVYIKSSTSLMTHKTLLNIHFLLGVYNNKIDYTFAWTLILNPKISSLVSWRCRIHRLHLYRGLILPQRCCCCRIHQLHFCEGLRLHQQVSSGPVRWSCRIHQLHLCWGVTPPQWVFCILH